MHAEQKSAGADRDDQRDDRDGEQAAPLPAGRGQEDQEQGAVADDRPEGMPAGEAVAGTVGDRMGDHRAQPANECLQDRIKRQHASAGDQEVDGKPPPAADGQHDRSRPGHRPQHAVTAQPGDGLDDADDGSVAGHETVQPGRRALIDGLKRGPLQPHENKQERE
jgi:hypothetical protein